MISEFYKLLFFQVLSDFYLITHCVDYSEDPDKMVDNTKAVAY